MKRAGRRPALLEHFRELLLQEFLAVVGAVGHVPVLHPQSRIRRFDSPGQLGLVQHKDIPGGVSPRIAQLAGKGLETKTPEIPKMIYAWVIQKRRSFQSRGLIVLSQNRRPEYQNP